jgi:nucleotide-binding universal stress UspA family protein
MVRRPPSKRSRSCAIGKGIRRRSPRRHRLQGYARARISGAPEGAAKVWAPLPDDLAKGIVEQVAAAMRFAGVKVGAELIVVGSQGMSGAKRLLGSVPNKVSHEARCNVLIVSTHKGSSR